MRVYNPDGSEAGACGNGTRCVARLMMEEQALSRVAIETVAGVLETVPGLRGYTVDMGRPGLGWDEIPLAKPMDTLHLDIEAGSLSRPTAVSMGNPHAVFFVEDAEAVDSTGWGLSWSGIRCFRSAPISASPRYSTGTASAFASSSVVRGLPMPAAAGLRGRGRRNQAGFVGADSVRPA